MKYLLGFMIVLWTSIFGLISFQIANARGDGFLCIFIIMAGLIIIWAGFKIMFQKKKK